MDKCGICKDQLDKIYCECAACLLPSHPKCNNLLDTSWVHKSKDNRATWRCLPCRENKVERKNKRSRKDSIGSDGIQSDIEQYEIDEEVFRSSISSQPATMAQIQMLFTKAMEPIQLRLNSIETSAKKVEEVKKTVEGISTQLESMSERLKDAETKINSLETKSSDLHATVQSLKNAQNVTQPVEIDNRFEAMERYTRRNNVIISGVPLNDNEDVYKCVIGYCSKIGVEV
ncbi:unnamed protein product, partial [Allacma fusca]